MDRIEKLEKLRMDLCETLKEQKSLIDALKNKFHEFNSNYIGNLYGTLQGQKSLIETLQNKFLRFNCDYKGNTYDKEFNAIKEIEEHIKFIDNCIAIEKFLCPNERWQMREFIQGPIIVPNKNSK
jgi:hypothetical protein